VRFRELLVNAARVLAERDWDFGQPDCRDCEFWKRETGGRGEAVITVKGIGGATASKAIQEIFRKAKPEKEKKRRGRTPKEEPKKFSFECASAQQIVWLKAMHDFVGAAKFDAMFRSGLHIGQYSGGGSYPGSAPYDTLPGDGVSFVNPQGKRDARNENSLYLGSGKYYGHPYGITDQEGMEAALNKDRVPGATEKASLRAGAIRPAVPRR
jgi:hypothetical protein